MNTDDAADSQVSEQAQTPELPRGLTDWESTLIERVGQHAAQEGSLIAAYSDLAQSTPDAFIRYLLELIIEDERRHHRMFEDLTNSLVSMVTMSPVEESVPNVVSVEDSGPLRDTTKRFLQFEREDQADLRKLRKEMSAMRNTTLWDLLIELAERDTEKHIRILEFIRDLAARP